MLFTQYGPTELLFESNDSASIKETKQPRIIKANEEVEIKLDTHNPDSEIVKPLPKLRVIPTTISAEEYDEPWEIYVKQEEVIFKPNYENIMTRKTNGILYFFLPEYKPSKKHDEVKPIGFNETEIHRIRLEVLYKANYYRKLYGMKELQLDDNINNYSQDWANQLAEKANPLLLNSTLKHRRPESLDFYYYGENLFTSLPIKHVGEVAVDICYYEVGSIEENDKYDITILKYEKIKRLTQLLWKVTETIGVGAAIGNDGKYYVVMNFNPRGNVQHFMEDNIPKFSDTQIDEAKKKLDSINENSDILLDLLEKGNGVHSLPGWKTMLYEKKIQT